MFEVEEKENKEEIDFEERQNAFGFFSLALKIALRESIDIGQFEDKQNKKQKDD